jgi:3,4-dehydroadipyl-CoA semialdehyde dehydrogenase
VEPGSDTWDLFVRDCVREITQKAGQKCTATRRLLVPSGRSRELAEAVAEGLVAVKVGDPQDAATRMGPLTNADQLRAVQDGIRALALHGHIVCGGPDRLGTRGCFLQPTLLHATEAGAPVFHGEEVFGPVASVLPYDGTREEAAALVALGQGSLVTSVYSDDREFPAALALDLAPWSGRLYLGSAKVAETGTGSGVVLPSLVHGGPGRAGGGEELGGLRGLDFYTQRTAVQGFLSVVEPAFGRPAGTPRAQPAG